MMLNVAGAVAIIGIIWGCLAAICFIHWVDTKYDNQKGGE